MAAFLFGERLARARTSGRERYVIVAEKSDERVGDARAVKGRNGNRETAKTGFEEAADGIDGAGEKKNPNFCS